MSRLYEAAAMGIIDLARKYLAEGDDANEQDKFGCFPLHAAAASGSFEMVKLLVDAGASVDSLNKMGVVPLYVAADRGNIEVVRFLIRVMQERSIKIEEAVLFIAAKKGHYDVVVELLEKGISAIFSMAYNHTPLHAAVESGNLEIVKLLVTNADLLVYSQEGDNTPLDLAAELGHSEIFEYLVAEMKKAQLFIGGDLFYSAINGGNYKVLKALLDSGAEPNILSSIYDTPLHLAVDLGNIEFIKLLLARGAFIDMLSLDGKTALYKAFESNKVQISRFLISETAKRGLVIEKNVEDLARRKGFIVQADIIAEISGRPKVVVASVDEDFDDAFGLGLLAGAAAASTQLNKVSFSSFIVASSAAARPHVVGKVDDMGTQGVSVAANVEIDAIINSIKAPRRPKAKAEEDSGLAQLAVAPDIELFSASMVVPVIAAGSIPLDDDSAANVSSAKNIISEIGRGGKKNSNEVEHYSQGGDVSLAKRPAF